MTQAIAHFMRQLEHTWDAHNSALQHGDVAAALTCLATRSSIQHIPALTGASDRAGVARFYAQDVASHLPADLTTVGTEINTLQTQLQASYSATASLEQLSLLKHL